MLEELGPEPEAPSAPCSPAAQPDEEDEEELQPELQSGLHTKALIVGEQALLAPGRPLAFREDSVAHCGFKVVVLESEVHMGSPDFKTRNSF